MLAGRVALAREPRSRSSTRTHRQGRPLHARRRARSHEPKHAPRRSRRSLGRYEVPRLLCVQLSCSAPPLTDLESDPRLLHLAPAALDYRLSPEVRYPASLLDAVNAYLYLTEGASRSPSVSPSPRRSLTFSLAVSQSSTSPPTTSSSRATRPAATCASRS